MDILARRLTVTVAPRRGQALVEAAIALGLLLTVLVALVQFALYVHARNIVAAAAQEGARVAAAEGTTLDDGKAHARRLLAAGLGQSSASLEVRTEQDLEAQTVTVEAQGRLRVIIPLVPSSSLPLRARATMSKEQFRPQGRSMP
ncbi:MAG: pilus assembly protein [Chloroflexota bacterium]|nr:pilus assembly protein [Chloroflexota bacterium]